MSDSKAADSDSEQTLSESESAVSVSETTVWFGLVWFGHASAQNLVLPLSFFAKIINLLCVSSTDMLVATTSIAHAFALPSLGTSLTISLNPFHACSHQFCTEVTNLEPKWLEPKLVSARWVRQR